MNLGELLAYLNFIFVFFLSLDCSGFPKEIVFGWFSVAIFVLLFLLLRWLD